MESKKFVCTYCGKEYDSPVERARCELSCWEKQEGEEAKQEQDARLEELHRDTQELIEKWESYHKDYPDPDSKMSVRDRVLQEVQLHPYWR